MKKMNNKGFTIVELVIVIAVIAILAAVMIPTFSGIIEKANDSAASQQFMAAYKEGLALAYADGKITANETVYVDGNKYEVKFAADNSNAATVKIGTATVDGTGKVTAFANDKDISGHAYASVAADGKITLN